MNNLEITYGTFQARGNITGLLNPNAYGEGEKQGSYPWKKLNFGVKVSEGGFVYVELMGFKLPNVKLIYRDPMAKRLIKDKLQQVTWDNRYTTNNYEVHMPVRLNFDIASTVTNDEKLCAYDAVDYIKENFNESDTVLVHGSIQITDYQSKPQEKYIIQGIYKDLSIKVGNEPEAYFTHEIIFKSLDIDDLNKKCNIHTYIIYKKEGNVKFVEYDFITRNREVYKFFDKNVRWGTFLKIYGRINYRTSLRKDLNNKIYINGFVKELEVMGGFKDSIIIQKYRESDFINNESPFKKVAEEEIDLLPF